MPLPPALSGSEACAHAVHADVDCHRGGDGKGVPLEEQYTLGLKKSLSVPHQPQHPNHPLDVAIHRLVQTST